MTSRLEEQLTTRVLVGDGGMGSLLAARLPRLRFPEEATTEAREAAAGAYLVAPFGQQERVLDALA